jgi:putative SOS response-associated peptidase YedK
MCGRFSIAHDREALERRFNARFAVGAAPTPRYNAAPAQELPVILSTDPRRIEMAGWGLVPPRLRRLSGRERLINVKAETLAEKRTFREDLEKRRCLVLADGFYEWKRLPHGRKVPYRFVLKNNRPFAFAGIWEGNDDAGTDARTFVIITTEPNELVAGIHDRMPAILSEEGETIWLNTRAPASEALKLLGPYPADKMRCYRVSDLLNRAAYDAQALILPCPP